MTIYRPSNLFAHLNALETHAKKKFSQNFLIDGNILNNIIRAADIHDDETVLEVGSGPGALTQALLTTGAQVIAVEMDPVLSKGLPPHERLRIITADILDFPLESLFIKAPKKLKVVANLPYRITTPLLARLLPLYPHISDLTLMVQKEVADRLVAKPHSKPFSRLSLLTQFYSTPKIAFTVSPNCFYPKPGVLSAVVHLKLHKPPPISSEKDFFNMIRSAFHQKRKMLTSSLKSLYEKQEVEMALHSLSLSPKARPEELSLAHFIALFEHFETRKKQPR